MGNGIAAAAHAAEVVKLEPTFSVSSYLATQHYKQKADRARHEAACSRRGYRWEVAGITVVVGFSWLAEP